MRHQAELRAQALAYHHRGAERDGPHDMRREHGEGAPLAQLRDTPTQRLARELRACRGIERKAHRAGHLRGEGSREEQRHARGAHSATSPPQRREAPSSSRAPQVRAIETPSR